MEGQNNEADGSGWEIEAHPEQPSAGFAAVVWQFDPSQGKITYVSPSYEALTGQSCESFYADIRSLTRLIEPGDGNSAGALFAAYFPEEEDTRHLVFRIRRDDGIRLCLTARIAAVPMDRGIQLVSIVEPAPDPPLTGADIPAAFTRELFECSPLPMWIYDPATLAWLAVNDAAVEHYGYTRNEFLGMNLRDIRPSQDVARLEQHRHEGLSGLKNHGRWRHCKKNGSVIEVEVITQDIQYFGRPARVAVLLDMTERLQTDNQLQQSRKMEAIGRLAGGIAHDFNNLLMVMNGRCELLLDALGADHEHRHALVEISRAGQRAARLVRQLLTFSRRQSAETSIVDLNRLLSEMETMLRRMIGEDIEVVTRLCHTPVPVCADPGRMEQVLMNLAINARDAMPHGGRLWLELQRLEPGSRCGLEFESGLEWVRLTVEDTGTGMDEDVRQHLFEPFFTTKPDGTGLGLSTVYGIVRQAGGSIVVKSSPGNGARFQIDLPLAPAGPARAEVAPASICDRSAFRSHSVLLVEDEEGVRSLIDEILRDAGFTVFSYASADDAMDEWKHSTGSVDLLVTDLVLPGLSGSDFAARMLRQYPRMKVLFISGYSDPVLFGGLETCAFLSKPFTPASLVNKVRAVLASPSGRNET